MFRNHAPHHQGARGLKVKHVLQIAIVTVVLTWVMYELNIAQKPPNSQGQDRSTFADTMLDSALGRKALKPEGEPGKLVTDLPLGQDEITTKSLSEENLDGSRAEEDVSDPRDKDLSELDLEHVTEQDEKSEDESQRDVGTDFAELKKQESKDATTSGNASTDGESDGDNHLASAVDGDKKTEETSETSFMEAFNADSVLKPKLDKLDEGEEDNSSRTYSDEQQDSAAETLNEGTENSEQEVEEKMVYQNGEEISQKSEAEGTQSNTGTDSQSQEQPDTNIEKTKIIEGSQEEVQVDEQKLDEKGHGRELGRYELVNEESQSQQQEEDKPEEKLDIHPEEQERKEQESSKSNDTVSGSQKYVAIEEEGAEVKIDNSQTEQESQKDDSASETEVEKFESNQDVDNGMGSSTQAFEGEGNKYVQPNGNDADQIDTNGNQNQLATEQSVESSQAAKLAEKNGEAQQDHNSGDKHNDRIETSESQQVVSEQKKDESVETDSKGAGDVSDTSNSKAEKIQEDDNAETVNTDASKQGDEAPKDKPLKQVTESNVAEIGESNTKVEDLSADKSSKADQEDSNTQQGQAHN